MGAKKGHKEQPEGGWRKSDPSRGDRAEGDKCGTAKAGGGWAGSALGAGGLPWLGGLTWLWGGEGGGLTWLWKASGICSLRRPQTRALLSSYRVTSPGGGGGGNSPREHMAAPEPGGEPGVGVTAETSGALGMRRLQAGPAGPSAPQPLTAPGTPRFPPGSPSAAPRPQPPGAAILAPLTSSRSRFAPIAALTAALPCGRGIKRAAAPLGKRRGAHGGTTPPFTHFLPQGRDNIRVLCTDPLHW